MLTTLHSLCLTTTYFQFRDSLYRQKYSCTTVSPVPPIVANIYVEEVEAKALTSFFGTTSRHWFRYVDDKQIKIKTKEVDTSLKCTERAQTSMLFPSTATTQAGHCTNNLNHGDGFEGRERGKVVPGNL